VVCSKFKNFAPKYIPMILTYVVFGILDKISQQPENCENRNDPDLVQAFLKKWWVESDFKAPNPPLSLRFKGSKQTSGTPGTNNKQCITYTSTKVKRHLIYFINIFYAN
jgi:hypothetical protein